MPDHWVNQESIAEQIPSRAKTQRAFNPVLTGGCKPAAFMNARPGQDLADQQRQIRVLVAIWLRDRRG